ncbi:MAG TPA: hypothetical protein VIG24_15735 [Acidimicrobiia bacterium]
MDQAKIRLPGAVESALLMELFTVMKEFFSSSNVWQEEIKFNVVPTTASYYTDSSEYTYDLLPIQGEIIRLIGVRNADGFPVTATMQAPGCVVLNTSPAAAEQYTALTVLTVVDPTSREGYPQFPDWVLSKYFNEILDGLLGRMMSQIAKPYSSPAIASMHLRKFKQGISMAKVESRRKNVYRGQSWRYPRSFAT